MIVSPPTFPLPMRFRLTLYALVLTAVAAFAHTEEDVTSLILTGVTLAVAWLLLDFGSDLMKGSLRRGVAWLLGIPPDLHTPPTPLPGAARANLRRDGARHAIARWAVAALPMLILNVIVLLAAVNLWREVKAQYDRGVPNFIMALIHFILVLLLCKLFERRRLRDMVQVVVLSLLIVVAATMFSNSSLFFFCILGVYFILLSYATLLLNLMAETQRLGRLAPMPAAMPGNGAGCVAGGGRGGPLALLRRDLRTVVQHCLFLALPVAVAVFLLVPRTLGNPLLTAWGLGTTQTGYNEVVQFRNYGELSQSDAEVMTVHLYRHDAQTGDNVDVGSEFSDLYFRGQVLDEYNNIRSRWLHGSLEYSFLADAPPEAVSDPLIVNYELKVSAGPTLFILAPSLPPDSRSFAYSAADMTMQYGRPRMPGTLKYTQVWVRNLPPSTKAPDYVIPGQLAPAPRMGPDGQPEKTVPTVMVSPQIDQLAHALIKDVIPSGQRIPPEQIRTVATIFETYLRTNYPYSLTFRQVDPKLDPTTDFLVNRKATGGHCEYFASAIVMMCRAVGLNARMVAGYHCAYDPYAFAFDVRQKHAHAWAEVYIPDQGWVLSDPTPISVNTAESSITGQWFREIRQLIQSAWLTMVVSFDNESRAAIARWISAKFESLLSLPPFPTWTTLAMWGAVLLLVVVAILLRRRFRRLAPLIESAQGIPHRLVRLSSHVSFLDDLLQLFDRSGLRRPDMTPLEFLQPHFSRLGVAAKDARWLIVTAYGVRFGGLHVDAALKHEIALAFKRVKSALRAKPYP